MEKSFKDSKIILSNRSALSISGVEKVFGANVNKINLRVSGSNLTITGTNLTVDRLNIEDGNIDISGTVDGMNFSKTATKGGFLKRIFKRAHFFSQ